LTQRKPFLPSQNGAQKCPREKKKENRKKHSWEREKGAKKICNGHFDLLIRSDRTLIVGKKSLEETRKKGKEREKLWKRASDA